MPSERDIIRRRFFFPAGRGVTLGVGDDAAIVRADGALAVCADALACGKHFFPSADPFRLGRKALAVSLSDLAAMGASPLWAVATLSAAPPHGERWIAEMADGMRDIAKEFSFSVVGGDLCASDATVISATLIGAAENGFISRDGAKAGDDLWLSGEVGEAALALRLRSGESESGTGEVKTDAKKNSEIFGIFEIPKISESARVRAFARMDDPVPRIALGRKLVGIASAALDVSDGLLRAARDLSLASRVAVRLNADDLPPSPALAGLRSESQLRFKLQGGDDYELLFSAPPENREAVAAAGQSTKTVTTRIGAIAPPSSPPEADNNNRNSEDGGSGDSGDGRSGNSGGSGDSGDSAEIIVIHSGHPLPQSALPSGHQHDFGE